jgi:GT2 family glycosyltransferase
MGSFVAACRHLQKIMPHDTRYEILIAEGSAPSRQRNRAALESLGDILYFLDDDSLIDPGNLTLCAEAMNDPAVAVVGGPSLTPESDSSLQRLFGSALASPFGSGAVCNRYREEGRARVTSDKELILCNLAIRRSVFIEQNGFNESLYPNEENEFLERVAAAGYLSMHLPSMRAFRSQRHTLRAFVLQMFSYGRGRAQQTLITGSWSLTSFIPLLFVIYLLLAPLGVKYILLLAPLVIYLLLALAASFQVTVRTQRLYSLFLVGLYPLMHAVNGCGLLWGLLNGRPGPTRDTPLRITRIKNLGETFPEQPVQPDN